jgi:glycosyltransferase involved in cell wall biosynthesis
LKKTIIHVIFNLGRGGAETMLVRVLKELTAYRNIVVTLQHDNSFENELECDSYICLNTPSLKSLPIASIRLRKLIRFYNADIVHSHLPVSNFVARLATPSNVPLLTTIHTSIATAADYKNWYIRLLDKITYRYKKSTIIAVSNNALTDYFSVLKVKPHTTYVLYTFVDITYYGKESKNDAQPGKLRVISVGSLREAKNYGYLIEAFQFLKEEDIELHIYGAGSLYQEMNDAIQRLGVKVILKGQVKNIHEILPKYDVFVMASIFEGFSLSVLEAMAARVPLLLSDIPSFKEQSADAAIYFDLRSTSDFVKKIQLLKTKEELRRQLASDAHIRLINNFTLNHHISKLKEIYKTALEES